MGRPSLRRYPQLRTSPLPATHMEAGTSGGYSLGARTAPRSLTLCDFVSHPLLGTISSSSPRPQRRVHRGLAFLLHLRLSRDNCTEFLTLAYIQHYIFHAGKRPDPTVSPPFCKPIGGAGNGEVTVRFTSTLTICAEGTLTFLAGCMRLASNTRAKRACRSLPIQFLSIRCAAMPRIAFAHPSTMCPHGRCLSRG